MRMSVWSISLPHLIPKLAAALATTSSSAVTKTLCKTQNLSHLCEYGPEFDPLPDASPADEVHRQIHREQAGAVWREPQSAREAHGVIRQGTDQPSMCETAAVGMGYVQPETDDHSIGGAP
jgi:hypothetical protein